MVFTTARMDTRITGLGKLEYGTPLRTRPRVLTTSSAPDFGTKRPRQEGGARPAPVLLGAIVCTFTACAHSRAWMTSRGFHGRLATRGWEVRESRAPAKGTRSTNHTGRVVYGLASSLVSAWKGVRVLPRTFFPGRGDRTPFSRHEACTGTNFSETKDIQLKQIDIARDYTSRVRLTQCITLAPWRRWRAARWSWAGAGSARSQTAWAARSRAPGSSATAAASS